MARLSGTEIQKIFDRYKEEFLDNKFIQDDPQVYAQNENWWLGYLHCLVDFGLITREDREKMEQ